MTEKEQIQKVILLLKNKKISKEDSVKIINKIKSSKKDI